MNDFTNTMARLSDHRQSTDRLGRLLTHLWEVHPVASGSVLEKLSKAVETHDRAFAVYLLFVPDIDVTSENLIEDFEAAHLGVYSSWQAARDDLMSTLGWPGALDSADIRDDGDVSITDLLTWDESAVGERLEELFHIIDLGDAVYVYQRVI